MRRVLALTVFTWRREPLGSSTLGASIAPVARRNRAPFGGRARNLNAPPPDPLWGTATKLIRRTARPFCGGGILPTAQATSSGGPGFVVQPAGRPGTVVPAGRLTTNDRPEAGCGPPLRSVQV